MSKVKQSHEAVFIGPALASYAVGRRGEAGFIITLPPEFCRRAGIEPGDRVCIAACLDDKDRNRLVLEFEPSGKDLR